VIVAELLKLAEAGQLYRGAKPVMWSPVEKTALAEAEVEYEDITSTQIDVAFEIVESPIAELVGAHAVIWTTTPWTIPVNQALAYGPEVEYVCRSVDGGLACSEELLIEDRRRKVRLAACRSALVEPLRQQGRARRFRADLCDGTSKAPTSPAPSPATRCTTSAGSTPPRARCCPATSSPPTRHRPRPHGARSRRGRLRAVQGERHQPRLRGDGRRAYRDDWGWLGGAMSAA
jgi:isoleucyl-tRNA synthetase